eukprot:6033354-Amphidinium_carterae.4
MEQNMVISQMHVKPCANMEGPTKNKPAHHKKLNRMRICVRTVGLHEKTDHDASAFSSSW